MGNNQGQYARINNAFEEMKEVDSVIPDSFFCPITRKMMREPVKLMVSCITYERKAVESYVERDRRDPLTGIPLPEGESGALLQPDRLLQDKIKNHLTKFPSSQGLLFPDDEKTREAIFREEFPRIRCNLQARAVDALSQLRSLKREAMPVLFRKRVMGGRSDEVECADCVALASQVPIVCFMGISRIGKSTLQNDLLGVPAFNVGDDVGEAVTKGASAALYQLDGQDFECIFLDSEGLTHGVTEFTKRLFYMCYAISDVIVWNTQQIAEDEFFRVTTELSQKMGSIDRVDRKPGFLLLLRDYNPRRYRGPSAFGGKANLNEYLCEHEKFSPFRNLQLFSSYAAYGLPERFYDARLDDEEYRGLMDTIKTLHKASSRFARTSHEIKATLKRINESGGLDVGLHLLMNHEFFSNFVLAPEFGSRERMGAINSVAIAFNWDERAIERGFLDKMGTELKPMVARGQVSRELCLQLKANYKEIYERVKNRYDNLGWISAATSTVTTAPAIFIGSSAGFGLSLGSIFASAGVSVEAVAAGTVSSSALAAGVTSTTILSFVTAPLVGAVTVGALGYGIGRAVGWVGKPTVETVVFYSGKAVGYEYVRYSLGPTDAEKAGIEIPREWAAEV